MPHTDYDFFGTDPLEKVRTLSFEEQLEVDAVSSFVKRRLLDGLQAGADEVLSNAVGLYSECFAEKVLFGRHVTTRREEEEAAADYIRSAGLKVDEDELRAELLAASNRDFDDLDM